MDMPNLFELASYRLKWLSDKQKAVSENIANADTAGFKAREVESFDSYLEAAEGKVVAPDAVVTLDETTWGQDLTGNNVVLEEQVLAASSASGQYRVAANLYKKAHEMVRTVVS